MQPYTYFLYHNPTGFKYYGSRYSKHAHPDDFWKTYFTSSKKVKELISQYGKDSFCFKIRQTFDTREACIKWEQTVINRHKILFKKDWLNQHNPGACTIHRKNFVPWQKGTKGLVVNSWKGRTGRYTPEHRANLALKSSKEYKDPLVRERHSKTVSGTGNPCYNTIWINKNNQHKRIPKSLLSDYITQGWVAGRRVNKNDKGQFSKCK